MSLSVLSLMGGAAPGGTVQYLDETDVQLVAGLNLVRFDSETRLQSIVHGSSGAQGITAVTTSSNRR
jgi:hypothetical protein